jgi:hypothetical protein
MADSGITRFAFLWTMFMVSLLFGGAYALSIDQGLSTSLKPLFVLIP